MSGHDTDELLEWLVEAGREQTPRTADLERVRSRVATAVAAGAGFGVVSSGKGAAAASAPATTGTAASAPAATGAAAAETASITTSAAAGEAGAAAAASGAGASATSAGAGASTAALFKATLGSSLVKATVGLMVTGATALATLPLTSPPGPDPAAPSHEEASTLGEGMLPENHSRAPSFSAAAPVGQLAPSDADTGSDVPAPTSAAPPTATAEGAPPQAAPGETLAGTRQATRPAAEDARAGADLAVPLPAPDHPAAPSLQHSDRPPGAVADRSAALVASARRVRELRSRVASAPAEVLRALDSRPELGRGVLDQEVSFLRIEALRRLGRAPEAAAATNRFRARYPSSIYLERLSALEASGTGMGDVGP